MGELSCPCAPGRRRRDHAAARVISAASQIEAFRLVEHCRESFQKNVGLISSGVWAALPAVVAAIRPWVIGARPMCTLACYQGPTIGPSARQHRLKLPVAINRAERPCGI